MTTVSCIAQARKMNHAAIAARRAGNNATADMCREFRVLNMSTRQSAGSTGAKRPTLNRVTIMVTGWVLWIAVLVNGEVYEALPAVYDTEAACQTAQKLYGDTVLDSDCYFGKVVKRS